MVLLQIHFCWEQLILFFVLEAFRMVQAILFLLQIRQVLPSPHFGFWAHLDWYFFSRCRVLFVRWQRDSIPFELILVLAFISFAEKAYCLNSKSRDNIKIQFRRNETVLIHPNFHYFHSDFKKIKRWKSWASSPYFLKVRQERSWWISLMSIALQVLILDCLRWRLFVLQSFLHQSVVKTNSWASQSLFKHHIYHKNQVITNQSHTLFTVCTTWIPWDPERRMRRICLLCRRYERLQSL